MSYLSKLERVDARIAELQGYYNDGWTTGVWFTKRQLVGSGDAYNRYNPNPEQTVKERVYKKKMQELKRYFVRGAL